MVNGRRASVLLALLVVVLVTPVEAQAYSHYGRWGHSNRRGYRGGRSAASVMASAYARQMRVAAAIRAAQAEVARAHTALRSTRVKLEREFSYSDGLANANQSYREGLRVINEATARLKDNPEYAAVLSELRATKEELSGNAIVDRSALESRAKLLEGKLERLREKAFEDDPAVQQARSQMHVSAVKEGELNRQFEGSITHNPQWVKASQSLDAARKKLATAGATANRGYAGVHHGHSRYRHYHR